jgi:hypothetical protein
MPRVVDELGKVPEITKLSKATAGYLEVDDFAKSDHHKGYFCYSCIYWINEKGGRCVIVDERGVDTLGEESGVIARHGCCNLWEPNWDEIREKD